MRSVAVRRPIFNRCLLERTGQSVFAVQYFLCCCVLCSVVLAVVVLIIALWLKQAVLPAYSWLTTRSVATRVVLFFLCVHCTFGSVADGVADRVW
jgi:hypothetical protein